MPYQAINQTFRFMSQTAFEVVRRFAQDNSPITFDQLRNYFSGSPGYFRNLVHRSSEQRVRRHRERFSRDSFPVSDELHVVVTNQWTKARFEDFAKYCAGLDNRYQIEEI